MDTYAQMAAAAAEGIDPRRSTSTIIEMAAIKAITYALLDVAEAIRSHSR